MRYRYVYATVVPHHGHLYSDSGTHNEGRRHCRDDTLAWNIENIVQHRLEGGFLPPVHRENDQDESALSSLIAVLDTALLTSSTPNLLVSVLDMKLEVSSD